MKTIVIVLILAVSVSGCHKKNRYRAVMESWQGSPVSLLIERWGFPETILDAPDGYHKVYAYSRTRSWQEKGKIQCDYLGDCTVRGGGTRSSTCKSWFIVDPKTKVVVGTRWRNC